MHYTFRTLWDRIKDLCVSESKTILEQRAHKSSGLTAREMKTFLISQAKLLNICDAGPLGIPVRNDRSFKEAPVFTSLAKNHSEH